jgi:ribosomal protein S14
MSETIEKKQVCRCENCGNEAEMSFTCTLPEHDHDTEKVEDHAQQQPPDKKRQVKGSAVCEHCGNEADMWIDL